MPKVLRSTKQKDNGLEYKDMGFRDAILILAVAVCSIIAMRLPLIGVLTFVFLGFFNPHSMTWGIARTLSLSQYVAVGTFIGLLFSSESKKLPIQREVVLMIAVLIIFGFTTIFAREAQKAVSQLINVSKIFLMVFVTIIIINSPKRLHLLLYVIALSLGLLGLKGGVFGLISRGELMVWGPENSFLQANNSIGMALSMNLPLLVFLIRRETRRWLRNSMILMFILSYPAIICTFSRGAWLGMLIVTGLLILKSKHRFIMITSATLIGLLFITIYPHIMPNRVKNRYEDFVNYEHEASAQSRFWNWETCKRVGCANLMTGEGFNYYSINIYKDYYPEFLQRWPGRWWSCHSAFFTVFAEHGLPGMFLWSALLISTLLSTRKIRLTAGSLTDVKWMAECAEMIQISIYSYLVTGIFLDTAYFDMLYYLIGITVVLKKMVIEHKIAQAQ